MLKSFLISIAREMHFLRCGKWNRALVTWMPLLAILLFGWIFSNSTPRQLPVVIADEDQSAMSRQLVRLLLALPTAKIVENTGNFEDLRAAVRNREAYAAVYIPKGAEVEILRGNQAHVYSFFNDLYYTSANLVQRDIAAAVAAFNARLAGARTGANRAVNPAVPNGAPIAVQTTLLFNAANSYEWGLGSSLIPAVLLLIMGGAVTVSIVREMSDARRPSWLRDAGGRLALAIITKVFLFAAIFTALGTLGILWLRLRGWPVNGSMPVIVLALFLMFLGNGFAMAVIAGLARGAVLPALSAAAMYTGAGIAFGDILFPVNTGSWFTKLMCEIMPYAPYMQVQTQQMQMGSPAADSLWFLCRLGIFTLIAFLLGFIIIRLVLRHGIAHPGTARLEAFDAHGRGGAGFMRGVRMVWWALKNEPGVSAALLAATVMYSFYYPAAYTAEVSTHLPVAIVDNDNSAQSRALIRKIMMMRAIDVAARPLSPAEARRHLERRKVDGVLVIEENYGRDALTGRSGGLALFGNNAFLVRSSVLLGALGEAAPAAALEIAEPQFLRAGIAAKSAAAPASVVPRPLFNTREGYGSFAVPAVGQLIVQQAMFFGILMVLGRRTQRAAEAGVVNPPMTAREFSGVFTAFVLLGLANAAWMNGFAFWIQDYPRGANIGGTLAFMPLFVCAVVAASMLIGSFVDRTERALQFFACTSLPFFFVAGVSWPVETMPPPLRLLTLAIPTTSAIPAHAKLNQMGASIAEVRAEIITLMIITVVCTAFAWWRLGGGKIPFLNTKSAPAARGFL